jgi:glutamine synthetase
VLVQDVTGENSPVAGFDFESGDSDFAGIADLSTLCLVPAQKRTAQVILDPCSLQTFEAGTKLSHPCRSVLANIVQRAQETHGVTFSVASELEFYLFRPGFQPLGDGRPAYSMVHLQDLRGLVERILLALPMLGLQPEAGLYEYAPGQLEVNFGPLPPLEMADRTFLFKNTVKELAGEAGFLATFMAKPLAQHSGSGYHLHASLWKDGANLFWNGTPDRPSDLLRHFVAGTIARTPECFAFLAPNVNSYRRHVLGEYVPSSASWGGDDRTVALRLPAPTPKAARLEHRIAGADANPHLLIAAILASGMEGIAKATRLEQQPNHPGPVFPRALADALEALDRSTWARDTFGDQTVEIFLTVKRQELQKFHSHITNWEMETYGYAL